jgi:hypothetical protein
MIQQGIDMGWRSTLLELYGRLLSKLRALFKTKRREPPSDDVGAVLAWRLQSYIDLRPPQNDANIDAIIHANKVSMATRMQSPTSTRPVVMPNSFSQALSERHSTDILNNTAGHKLVQSALDHLHTSIRYAKAGDAEAARLHADIMNSALKEAGNYASENEYRELVSILDKELNRLS